MLALKFEGRIKYGLFVGENGRYILSDTDAVHAVYEAGEVATIKTANAKMEMGRTYTLQELDELDTYQDFTLEALIAAAENVPVKDFIDYWGIKSRIHYNYNLLIHSVGAIGGDVDKMPGWGKK